MFEVQRKNGRARGRPDKLGGRPWAPTWSTASVILAGAACTKSTSPSPRPLEPRTTRSPAPHAGVTATAVPLGKPRAPVSSYFGVCTLFPLPGMLLTIPSHHSRFYSKRLRRVLWVFVSLPAYYRTPHCNTLCYFLQLHVSLQPAQRKSLQNAPESPSMNVCLQSLNPATVPPNHFLACHPTSHPP